MLATFGVIHLKCTQSKCWTCFWFLTGKNYFIWITCDKIKTTCNKLTLITWYCILYCSLVRFKLLQQILYCVHNIYVRSQEIFKIKNNQYIVWLKMSPTMYIHKGKSNDTTHIFHFFSFRDGDIDAYHSGKKQ